MLSRLFADFCLGGVEGVWLVHPEDGDYRDANLGKNHLVGCIRQNLGSCSMT